MEARASQGRPRPAHSRQPEVSTFPAKPPTKSGTVGPADRPADAQRVGGTAIALFAEPVRGTPASGPPVMILGLDVATTEEPAIFGVDAEGRPKWWILAEITFDWRWSVRLGRWADLEEIIRPSTNLHA